MEYRLWKTFLNWLMMAARGTVPCDVDTMLFKRVLTVTPRPGILVSIKLLLVHYARYEATSSWGYFTRDKIFQCVLWTGFSETSKEKDLEDFLDSAQDGAETGPCDDVVLSSIDIDAVYEGNDRGAGFRDLHGPLLLLPWGGRQPAADGEVNGRQRSRRRRLAQSWRDDSRGAL